MQKLDILKDFQESFAVLWNENTAARWILPAIFFRLAGYFCLLFYVPIFFTQTYPDNIDEFSKYNAIIDIFVANISALLGGYLSDRLEKDTYWAKPGIIIGTTALAAPLICSGLLTQDSFNFSIIMLSLHFLFG